MSIVLKDPIMLAADPATPAHRRSAIRAMYDALHHIEVVSVTSAPALAVGEPTPVLDLNLVRAQAYAHLRDGRILLVQGTEEEEEIREINVVLNLQEEIKRKLAEAE